MLPGARFFCQIGADGNALVVGIAAGNETASFARSAPAIEKALRGQLFLACVGLRCGKAGNFCLNFCS
jgi:hypothetical protein